MTPTRRAVVSVLAALGACRPSPEQVANGDDPIAALTSTVRSTRYGTTYWMRAAVDDSALWERAKAYCFGAKGPESPTCVLVRDVDVTRRMAAPKPERPGLRFRSPGRGT